jgi:hypothetical protein
MPVAMVKPAWQDISMPWSQVMLRACGVPEPGRRS